MNEAIDKLEELQGKVWSSDLYIRQEAGSELLTVLSEDDDVFDCGFHWDSMCNGLVRWISGTNYKISVVALKAIAMIATRMGQELSPTITSMLPAIIDRLGDSKETVRKESASLIQILMSHVKSPKEIMEEMVPKVMSHKNAKVKEGFLLCLSETLLNFGYKELSVSRIVPSVLELVSDSNALVRDQAFETLCDIYKMIGEPLRNDIIKRRSLPLQKEKMVIQRFDDLLHSGLVTQAPARYPSQESLAESNTHSPGGRLAKSRSSGTLNKRSMPLKKSASAHKRGGLAGADSELLSEENLDEKIQEYIPVEIDSARGLVDFCNNIGNVLENSDDWEKRIKALKELRGLMFSGVDHFKEFKQSVNGLSRALEKCVKDLRSQVVREACLTVSAMSTEMKNSFGPLAEKLLHPLFSQLLINVKVMNVSAHICCRRIVSCTQYAKMIPIICDSVLKSKSAMCRRRCAEYIELIFQVWDVALINKNLTILESSIKSGINDADSETRTFSRQTFWLYHEYFTKNAENMMKTFDTSKQKMLRETKLGKSGSVSSTASTLKRGTKLAPGSSATLPKPPTISKSTPDLSQLGKYATSARTPRSTTKPRTGTTKSNVSSPTGDKMSIKPRRMAGGTDTGVKRSVSARSVNNLASPEQRSATLRRANKAANQGRVTPSQTRTTATPRSTAIRKSASANLHTDSLASAFGRNTIARITSQDSIASSNDSSANDDINDIAQASESPNWKIREEAVIKLKQRINEERGFNARERKVVLQLFEHLLNDNHARILGLTLDVLDEFLTLYRTNLSDWGCNVLAKTFYLQSLKQTASNYDRVIRLLDTIHRSFPCDVQLTWCFLILDSRQVNSNSKMKKTLLEYISCIFEVMDPMEFIQTKESTIGLKVLLSSTFDPKAQEIRNASRQLLATMFRHSPPVFSNILNTLNEDEQGQCVMLLQEMVPDMLSHESEVLIGYPGFVTRKAPLSSDQESLPRSEDSASLFDAINQRFGSSPGGYDVETENINPDNRSFNKNIMDNSLKSIPKTPAREKSFNSASSIDGVPVNNPPSDEVNGAQAVSLDNSLINGLEQEAVFRVLEALLGGTKQEKDAALVETINLLRDEQITADNSYDLLSAILTCTEDDDVNLVSNALKVLNKFLIYQPDYLTNYCEEVVTKLIRAKCTLNPAQSESLYKLLIKVYKPEAILALALPMLENETYPTLLTVINLTYTTLKQNTPETQPKLEGYLSPLTASLCPHCSHVETNVRKQSIFCLVELLLIFGTDRIDPLLATLTVSQKKLVYLYYNRHQRNAR